MAFGPPTRLSGLGPEYMVNLVYDGPQYDAGFGDEEEVEGKEEKATRKAVKSEEEEVVCLCFS